MPHVQRKRRPAGGRRPHQAADLHRQRGGGLATEVAAPGKKRVTLELGGNAGVIVHSDADLEYAAQRCVAGGFSYAGQTCISVQRILVHQPVFQKFTELLLQGVAQIEDGRSHAGDHRHSSAHPRAGRGARRGMDRGGGEGRRQAAIRRQAQRGHGRAHGADRHHVPRCGSTAPRFSRRW